VQVRETLPSDVGLQYRRCGFAAAAAATECPMHKVFAACKRSGFLSAAAATNSERVSIFSHRGRSGGAPGTPASVYNRAGGSCSEGGSLSAGACRGARER